MTNMLASTEARWFFSDACPPEVRTWFSLGGPTKQECQRVDRYLILPGTDTISAKQREPGDGKTKFELKVLEANHGIHTFGDKAVARLSQWLKWTIDADLGIPDADPQWITVNKTRWLRKYDLGADAMGHPQPVPPDTWITAGCGFELTELTVPGGTPEYWWTLGLEAFGARNVEGAIATARAALNDGQGPELPLERCLDYPRWMGLLQLGR